ncbi:MAG: 50S ribosomal protein L32 [Actinobacteria bacterium]|nr:50S ribosomal protein L32 [Actinomycetota bacterium]MBN2168877.1 50S ribosomal protein L32 [Actinomycetota bacterium]
MAVPKRRKSKTRKNMRRSHHSIEAPTLAECPQCHQPKLPHRVCRECGYYDGRQIFETE